MPVKKNIPPIIWPAECDESRPVPPRDRSIQSKRPIFFFFVPGKTPPFKFVTMFN
ncbi:hypothetical protein BC941DRAFT_440589 [Chlamydoabsidia padenii]|nr:hypothetical protein BC941DRAFT_440589 [Chlamydoabsidia padenii]